MVFARLAEGVAGHGRHLFRPQQPRGEFFARDAQFPHGGVHIERPARLEAGQPRAVEKVYHEQAALVVLVAHGLDHGEVVAEAVFERLDGGILGGGGGAQQGVLVDLEHGGVQFGRGAHEADAPARHGERL